MKTLFKGALLVTDSGITPDMCVLIDGTRIAYVGGHSGDMAADRVIDARGLYLSAGFIELHAHGGGGYDYMDATREAFGGIARHHAAHGVTSMLATTLAGSDAETEAALEAYNAYAGGIDSVNYLGVHLEGPYFNVEQRGAQDARYIKPPEPAHYNRLLDYGCVKRLSAAPELNGALELGEALKKRGIIASIAHTCARYEQVLEAAAHGYTMLTHLYSGMTGVHREGPYRVCGAIEAGLLLEALTAEVIADNRHLPECLLKLIYKCKGADGMTLTSDASRGAGLPDGAVIKLGSLTNGQEAIIEDDVAMLPDRTAFAGSVASADRLIRTMKRVTGVKLHEAVRMMTANPARLLGVAHRKGGVREGMDADIVLFDENIDIKHTMVMGVIND